MIHREADGTILTHAGPEIGVASTKAFTAQMVSCCICSRCISVRLRGTIDEDRPRSLAADLAQLPLKIEQFSTTMMRSKNFRENFSASRIFFISAAGSIFRSRSKELLKLKEISYIHAEGYPAGEMKHGPNRADRRKTPCGRGQH